jgi:hypothetical protein
MSLLIPVSRQEAQKTFDSLLQTIPEAYPVEGKLLVEFFENPLIKSRWHRAPGSTALRFHHAFEGGLLTHTMEVLNILVHLSSSAGIPHSAVGLGKGVLFASGLASFVSFLDIWEAALLHDINKTGDPVGREFYVPNFLKNGSRSDKVPYETADVLYDYKTNLMEETPQALAAHRSVFHLARRCWRDLPDGELSLAIVAGVSPELYESLSEGVKFAIRHHDGAYGRARRDLAGTETPLQLLLHFADMWSSRMNREDYR